MTYYDWLTEVHDRMYIHIVLTDPRWAQFRCAHLAWHDEEDGFYQYERDHATAAHSRDMTSQTYVCWVIRKSSDTPSCPTSAYIVRALGCAGWRKHMTPHRLRLTRKELTR